MLETIAQLKILNLDLDAASNSITVIEAHLNKNFSEIPFGERLVLQSCIAELKLSRDRTQLKIDQILEDENWNNIIDQFNK